MPDPARHPPAYPDDEIDLFELAGVLWQAKWFIGLITGVVLAAAVAYALLAPATYEAQAKTLPPTASDLAGYNTAYQLLKPAPGTDVRKIGTGEVYKVFLRQLQSAALRERFFNELYLPANAEGATETERETQWRRMNEALSIKGPDPKAEGNVDEASVTLRGRNAQDVADWTNAVVRMAAAAARQQLLDDLQSTMQLDLTGVETQIDSLRTAAKSKRDYEIARVESALQLARAIGLQEPPARGNLITSYSGPTLYLRGARTLQAELDLLKARTSDDPYIERLPALLEAKNLLARINLDAAEKMSVVTVDQPAIRPWRPVKPKKRLMVALGLVLGLMLGTGAALVRHAWRQHGRAAAMRG